MIGLRVFFPTLSNDELFYLFEGVYNILHMLYPSTDFATSVVFYYFRQIKSRGILVQSSSMCSACKICLVLFFCYDSIRFVVATFKMSVSHWVNSNIKMNDLICISYLIFIVAKQDREINVKRLKIVPDLTGNRCNLISYLNQPVIQKQLQPTCCKYFLEMSGNFLIGSCLFLFFCYLQFSFQDFCAINKTKKKEKEILYRESHPLKINPIDD